MPLARIASNKQIWPVELVTPGTLGINTEQSASILPAVYATDTLNCIIDANARLAARQGLAVATTTPITGAHAIQSAFEYNGGASVGYMPIIAWTGGISNNLANPSANDIHGSVPVTSGRWFFQNFNNKVIGFQPGQTPIVYTGTGNFTTIAASAGTVPTGGVGCVAFGRVWTVQADLQTIQYSGLLNETDWGSSDSGTFDMHTVWSNGTDEVQAIFAFNSSLVICGLKHIIFYTDGRGSLLGMDPTQAYVYDIITGTGCISQFTVQPIGQSDVLFLGPVGVQSLSRLVNNDNNPLITVTKYNRSQILAQISQEVLANITATYDPLQGFYLLALPATGVVWCLDLRRPYQDDIGDTCFRTTYWAMTATALMTTHVPLTYVARTPGQIAFYSGAADEGATYNFNWQSPWLQMDPQISEHLKMLKRISAITIAGGGQSLDFGWNVDFGVSLGALAYALPASGILAQYGLGQYGLSQYGGGGLISNTFVHARARGQYYQFSLGTTVTGIFALQQVQVAFKIGRIA